MSIISYLLTAHSHEFLSKLRENKQRFVLQGLTVSVEGQKEV